MSVKIGYVGSTRGELSVMVTHREAITSVDLFLPNVPAFVLRIPLSELDGSVEAFQNMMGAVLVQTTEYLKTCQIEPRLVAELHQNVLQAMTDISEDDHADRTGSGGSGLMEKIVELEPLDVYEVKFDIPKGLIPAMHQHVVTAGLKGRQKSTLAAFHAGALAQGVDSPAFRAWFAGSKVVNPDGTPKVLYHGTASPDIYEFDGEGYSDRGAAGFFTENPAFAEEFANSREQEERDRDEEEGQTYPHGPQIYPVYIRALNIFDARNPEHTKLVKGFPAYHVVDYSDLESSAYEIWDAGFDAYLDFERGIKVPPTGLAVKSPNQIKSAIGNNGAYDPNDNRITAAFHTITRTPTPVVLPPNFHDNPHRVQQARPSLRDLVRKFKVQQNKPLTGPLYVLVYDVNGRPVGVRSIKGPGWKGIGGKVAGVLDRAGWLLPDGTYLDARVDGGVHESVARRYLKLDLSESNHDASDIAITKGWIRLWETPYGYVAIEMGPLASRSLQALQRFFADHREWMAAGDILLQAGSKCTSLPFDRFMAMNTPSDLRQEAVMAAGDPIPGLIRKLHEELVAEYARDGFDLREDQAHDLVKEMVNNYWYDLRKRGVKPSPALQRALTAWNNLSDATQLAMIQAEIHY